MVNIRSSELDLIFYALSDATRRRILEMLGRQMRTVGELAAPFRMSLAAVSKHIKILEEASLLKRTRDGRVHHCELNAASFHTAEACIRYYQKFWENRLDAFENQLLSPEKLDTHKLNTGKKETSHVRRRK